MLVKAKGGSFADLTKDNIVDVDFGGAMPSGSNEPSREFRAHALIYRMRPRADAVFHGRSPWSMACAARFDRIPLAGMQMEMKMGAIPVMVSSDHADDKMVDELATFLTANRGVPPFIQRRHGVFNLSEDIGQTEMLAELVEECAKIAMLELISEGRS
jgi:ribulose-5-phosphate 4-epimerase/fuculose-1-phosphate aldolase